MGRISIEMLRWLRCTGCFFLLLSLSVNVGAKIIDGVAAVVNDKVILRSELLELVGPYKQEYAAKYSGKELNDRIRATVRSLLNGAIERQLLLDEAARLNVEIEKSRIDQAVKTVRERFGSDEKFREALAQRGETMASFRQKAEEDLLTKKTSALKWREIDKDVTITKQDVQDYYEKHEEDFTSERKPDVLKIFASADRSLPAAQRALRRGAMEEILAEVRRGADFERLAKRFAEGGTSIPVEVGRGNVPSDIERSVLSMHEGKVSDILESDQGFYIVKVLRTDSFNTLQNPELRAMVESVLKTKRVQEKYNEWLKKLRDNARISIYFR